MGGFIYVLGYIILYRLAHTYYIICMYPHMYYIICRVDAVAHEGGVRGFSQSPSVIKAWTVNNGNAAIKVGHKTEVDGHFPRQLISVSHRSNKLTMISYSLSIRKVTSNIGISNAAKFVCTYRNFHSIIIFYNMLIGKQQCRISVKR